MDEDIVKIGSGVGSGILDAILQMKIPELTGQYGPLLGIEPLPPLSYWVNFGASLAVLGAGEVMRKPIVKTVGKGMALYSLPKLVQVAMSRAGSMLTPPARVAAVPQAQPQPYRVVYQQTQTSASTGVASVGLAGQSRYRRV